MKKIVKAITVSLLCMSLGACGNDDRIHVLTREQGSGTRGAFIELFGIEKKNEKGEKEDQTIASAEETNSTSVMITTVSNDPNALGYISLGALNDQVKAVKIDDVEATIENVKNGSYKVSRPFNVVTKEGLSEVSQDFMKFVMSEQGQKIVEEEGYISEGNQGEYVVSNLSGVVKLAGSSSVTPVMEKMKEAYMKLNPNVVVEVQQFDSTTGVTNVLEGLCDIGMASRELKESEIEKGAISQKICIDGIALIVHVDSVLDNLTSQQVLDIYTGHITTLSEVKEYE